MVLLHNRLHIHPRISITTSPNSNRRRKSLHDERLSMRFGLTRDLPLKRSFAYYSITTAGSREQTMATKSENLVGTSTDETDKVEDKKMEVSPVPPLPPPPEKPEPGDCCGNGCVRCVWDMYYEELEEYNKLCSSISGENKSN